MGSLALALSLSVPASAQDQPGNATQSDPQMQGGQSQWSSSDRVQSQAKFDQSFMKKAAQGSKAEIEMAELAMDKASNPEVKELSQKIKQDHEQASQKLQQIAKSENVELSEELPRDAEKTKEKLSNMEGEQFDRAYAQFLVNEHKKDIKEFQRASERATDPQVKEFAQNTLPKLEQHLQHAEQLSVQVQQTARPEAREGQARE